MVAIARNIFKVALLAVVWLVLRETVTIVDIAIGVGVSAFCIWYSQKFLPLSHIGGVRIFRLFTYLFYLIGQIYLGGFHVVKMIILGADEYTFSAKTVIKNDALKVILADSITLTPGSILIDMTGDNVSVVCIQEKTAPHPPRDVEFLVKGNLEKWLLRAQKEGVAS